MTGTRIIELIGPSAVGKTTVYNQLRKRWRPELNWFPADMVLKGGVHSSRFGDKPLLSRLFPSLIQRTIPKARESNDKSKSGGDEAVAHFMNQYSDFVAMCWHLIDKNRVNDHMGRDSRLHGASVVYRRIEHLAKLLFGSYEKLCFWDEGLVRVLHSLFGLHREADPAEIEAVLSLMPLPSGVIWLKASPEVLAARVSGATANRRKRAYKHRDQSDIIELIRTQLKNEQTIVELLEQRGVAVLQIDAARPTSEVVDELSTFLERDFQLPRNRNNAVT